ncbi:unnamed protein product [Ostreobium quekettii]|uniref:TOG domain-containing protein n=1 Tax=Ostreobium quekettii TaxID=121088 RepID=A0A8S1J0F6_9CHLO|nr:unnamed protein product [Ostreobium quekettii]
MSDDEKAQIDEARKKPLCERVEHKLWKVRLEAFELIKSLCAKIVSEDDPVLSDVGPMLAKATSDSNAAALDKALEATSDFLQKGGTQHAARACDRICAGIVGKCLSGRPWTVQKATVVFLDLIEMELADKAVESVVNCFSHKTPKVVVAALDMVHQAVSTFGTKVVPPQPILKALPPLFESRDAKAREKVKALVAELSRWVGASTVKTILFEKMRDAMKEDVEKLIEAAPKERPAPQRITRREQARLAELAEEGKSAQAPAQEATPMVEDEPECDVFDLSEPREILHELKKPWWESLANPKWTIRKGALTELKTLASSPRLVPGDYGDVCRELKKIIAKDSMVAVVAEAIHCVAALSKGLRGEFLSYSRIFCPLILEKFKEKNLAVCAACHEALAAFHKFSFQLVDIQDDIIAALGHNNPKVKQETLDWLKGCIDTSTKQEMSKVLGTIIPAVTKAANDPTPAIREKAFAALCSLSTKVSSATAIDKILQQVDESRRGKLEGMINAARGTAGEPSSSTAAATKPAAKKASPPPSPMRSPSPMDVDSPKAPARPPRAAARPSSSAGPKQSGSGAGGKPPMSGGSLADDMGSFPAPPTKASAVEQLSELLGEGLVNQLTGALWKERLDSVTEVVSKLGDIDVDVHGSTLVQGIAHAPGWGEKNFQVMSKQFELLKHVATNAKSVAKSDAFVAIDGLAEKVADIKLKAIAFECLSVFCERVGPPFVFNHIHSKAEKHKNPKILAETLNWMGQAIGEFGLQPMNVKSLLEWVQTDVNSTNAQVRNSAVQLLGVLHRFVGPTLANMIRPNVKPALMSTIESEFEKNPQDASFVPTRKSAVKPASKTGSASGGKSRSRGAASPQEASPAPSVSGDDFLPRQDISAQITPALINKLGSANWKERKEGLDDVEQILAGAGNRIDPCVGDLFVSLKARFADSNRNLTAQTLRLIAKIATAMGKAVDRQARFLLQPALACMSDSKTQVRAAVVEMMGAWAKVTGCSAILPDIVQTIGSPKCSVDGRKECIVWITGQAKEGKLGSSTLESAVKGAAIGCADKNGSVRAAGTGLVAQLVEIFGNQTMSATQYMEGALKTAVVDAIQKAGGGRASPPDVPAAKAPTSSKLPGPARPSSASGRPGSAGGAAGSRTRPGKPVASARAPKEDPMMDDAPLIVKSEKKADRARKNRFKRPKWEGVAHDEEAMLKAELEPHLSNLIKPAMFAKDFKKHCIAADLICGAVDSLYDEIISCLDLILRWAVIRICEAKTESLLHTLAMLKAIFKAMIENGYRLSDYEAVVLMPCLVEKSGHNQDRIRKDHRELMGLAMQVYSKARVYVFVADGLESKNNRTKIECAEEIGCIIDREGIRIALGSKQAKAMQVIAKSVSERDKSLRAACLSTLAVIYDFEADDIWSHLGHLTEQQQSLIVERLKYRERELAKSGLTGGYRNEDAVDEQMEGSPEPPQEVAAAPQQQFVPPPDQGFNRHPSSFGRQFGAPGQTAVHNGGTHPSFRPGPGAFQRPLPGASPQSFDAKPRRFGPPQVATGVHQDVDMGGQASPVRQPAAERPTREYIPEDRTAYGARSQSPILPDPPGPCGAKGERSDEEISSTWVRAMVTAHSSNMDEAIDALKVLCYELMEASTPGRASDYIVNLLRTSADELVKELCSKLDQTFAEATAQLIVSTDPPSARGCKYSLNTMMQTFGVKWMALAVDKQTLLDVISSLLQLLLDDRLPRIQEGGQLMRAMNVLMLKVMENANKTQLFESLLFLLRSMPPKVETATPDVQGRFMDLAVKCLIKTTKAVGGFMEELDLESLLLSIHEFFVDLGVEEIRRRGAEDDKPLRMVKTILHELCKIKGSDILDYIGLLPRDENPPPIICAYIDLNLTTLHNTGLITGPLPRPCSQVLSSLDSSSQSPSPPSIGSPMGFGNPPISPDRPFGHVSMNSMGSPSSQDDVKADLAAIFKKIGDKNHSKAGMEELFQFQMEHPLVDIGPYLAGTSEAFKAYIERGISKIKSRRGQDSGADRAAANGTQQVAMANGVSVNGF